MTAAFVQRLGELGWIEGRTVAIEYRWAEGRKECFAEIAAEFVKLPFDIVFTSWPAVPAVKQATSVIPIVLAARPDRSLRASCPVRPGAARPDRRRPGWRGRAEAHEAQSRR